MTDDRVDEEWESLTSRFGAPRGRGPRRGAIVVAVIAILIVAGTVAAYVFGRSSMRPDEAPSAGQRPAPAVDPNVVTLDGAQLQNIKVETVGTHPFTIEKSAPGKIAFNEEVSTPVFSPYTGRVTRLIAKPGDEVIRGSALFEIDTPDLVQAGSDLINAVSALRKARTVLDLARRTEERQRRLFDAKAASRKDLEQAESDLKNAESDLHAAEGALAGQRSRLRVFGKTDAEIAKIEEQRVIDRMTRVVSPIAGTITTRKVGPGQYVKLDNPDPLFTIADLSTMWMLANVAEVDVPLMQVGQPIEVSVMAYPKELFKARIAYIGAAVDPATRRVPVRAEVDNRGRKLKPEMFASFRIITDSQVQSVAVPVTAVVRDGDKTSVWVAQKENEFVRRPVTLGTEQDGRVQVLAGLASGERVATEGSVLLSNIGKT